MNKERLLNVAKALRESPNPGEFTMERYGTTARGCRTPACALGHYAYRTDLQDEFTLSVGVGSIALRGRENISVDYWGEQIKNHFGLDRDSVFNLFATCGCGGARTAIEAAKYIENFVRGADNDNGS